MPHGKEIYTFFFTYQKQGIIGIILSSAIIGYVIYKALKLIKKYDIQNYHEFLDLAINNKPHINTILNTIINTFLLITFLVMSAGFSAYFKQEFGIHEGITAVIFAGLCYIILNKDMKGIVLINWVLVPLIIIAISFLGIKAIRGN